MQQSYIFNTIIYSGIGEMRTHSSILFDARQGVAEGNNVSRLIVLILCFIYAGEGTSRFICNVLFPLF